MMNKKLLIGLDLSINSTGITVCYQENDVAKNIQFFNVVYEGKKSKKVLSNINRLFYRMPDNINLDKFLDKDQQSDFYSKDQIEFTIKIMMAKKYIIDIVKNIINRFELTSDNCSIYFNIEGFVGSNSPESGNLRSDAGLKMLHGQIRMELIQLMVELNFNDVFCDNSYKIYVTSPSDLKKKFSGNGAADKVKMVETFIKEYDGLKLIPDLANNLVNHVDDINDIVDSFALVYNIMQRIHKVRDYGLTNFDKKQLGIIPKRKKKKVVGFDAVKNSIPKQNFETITQNIGQILNND